MKKQCAVARTSEAFAALTLLMLQTACASQTLAGSEAPAVPRLDSVSAPAIPAPIRSVDRAAITHTRSGSWMTEDAKNHDLLYISDVEANEVYVFDYPDGKLKGTLSGFNVPTGLCSDIDGNVWIPNLYGHTIVEYKHGGKSPIAVLKDADDEPDGCAVDPLSGDLAVANYSTVDGGQGNIAIFKHAKGKPRFYSDSAPFFGAFCGYDNKGNLFFDGLASASSGFVFAELAKGKRSVTNIPLSGAIIYYPGGVQWDGTYVAVGDQHYRGANTSAIYQTTGANGKIVGKTTFDDPGRVAHWWIQNSRVVAPNITTQFVRLYRYPAGGHATKTIGPYEAPSGATVSVRSTGVP